MSTLEYNLELAFANSFTGCEIRWKIIHFVKVHVLTESYLIALISWNVG